MRITVLAGLMLALSPCGLVHAASGPQPDLLFASLTPRALIAPPPFISPADLDLLAAHPAPLVPGSPFLSYAQAARIAKAFVLEGYFDKGIKGIKVRSFSYSSPEGLVNWVSPQVTFLKELNIPKYHGPAWQIHFVAPRRPGTPANMIEMPGDDFSILLARDGSNLGVIEACD